MDQIELKHPYTCGLCSWGRDGAYHDKEEYDKHMKLFHWTGNPTCWICGNEYEPFTGDGDGACYYCYNGVPRE